MRSLTTSSANSHFITPIPNSLYSHAKDPHTTSLTLVTKSSTPLITSSSHVLSHPVIFQAPDALQLHIQPHNHHLSINTQRHIHKVLQKGWADVTINRYSSALQEFMRFCDLENIPNHFRLPADEFVLCAFAASSAGKHAGDTARGKISAIKAWHTIHNVVWKGSARLRYVLNGVDRLAPAKCCIRCVRSHRILGSPRNPSAYMLHLPHTKTHHRGQDVVIVEQQGPINPISLLKNHLHLSHTPHTLPLFAYATHEGHQSFTKRTFLRRCNLIWHSLGYPHTTGHCFRIGGTTELLVAGTPPDVVKAMGHWSSDSFHRYWRSLDDIVPQHARNLSINPRKRKNPI
ncbi:hypothetical protein BYT27DRAFT_6743692 [Phlegmacium glaucopus]|nr:hypothetical protein BYT27DRAFT_6743692 [Phlegmacium glaucopus]